MDITDDDRQVYVHHTDTMDSANLLVKGMNDMIVSKSMPRLALPELVEAIDSVFADESYDAKSPAYIEKVRLLMESYDPASNDWKRFEFWDEKKNYTRNLIATDNEKYTLMLLCWNPRKASPIHSHAGSNCWMRIVDGSCQETRYSWPTDDTPMKLLSTSTFASGACAFICDEVGLHRIENTSAEIKAVSLHLYAPPFDSCYIFLDPSTGKKDVCNVTFYSQNGERVEYS